MDKSDKPDASSKDSFTAKKGLTMMITKLTDQKRLINVSNRLPIKLSKNKEGGFRFQASEGGLATGLKSVLKSSEDIWIGWPGAAVAEEERMDVSDYLLSKALHPVYLTQDEVNGFYEGFSNETLWPLFHYFPSYSVYKEEYWNAYVTANRKFADAVIEVAKQEDVVWIHDYQLMLVPQMVREELPDIMIGYFQHIPFPDYEIFRALPWKSELVEGLLGADIIGFQTDEDARYFRATTEKILKNPCPSEGFLVNGRSVAIQSFPIGIDYDKFRLLADHDTTEFNAQKIKTLIPAKIALSVDRLDYSKGIIQRLKAYELFLERYTDWHQKVTLIHIIVPSRDTVTNYKELKLEMDQLISSINGKYATLGWQPIHHYYQSFDPFMLSAFYKCADLAIVTPLRDGMNLVSKEYIAGNVNRNGILLLGEAAGAANELHDAILLNPNDTDDFARKIYEGLTIPAEEKQKRMSRMQQVIADSDIFKWANSFLYRLMTTVRKKRKKSEALPIPFHIAS